MANPTLLFSLLASVMLAISTARFAAVGVQAGNCSLRSRFRRASNLRGLRQAAEVARLNSNLQSSRLAPGALPWRVMEIAEVIDESDDCRSFYLVDPNRESLPAFRPGQHVLVRPAMAGAYQTTRCYSLSSLPDARYWRITVKRQSCDVTPIAKKDSSGGLSIWLHEKIGPGDCLLVGGPNGKFFLEHDNSNPLVLLSAGVGITPMASMLRWSLESTPQRPVTLLYQAKDTAHWPLGEDLHRWSKDYRNCRVVSFFSRWTGEGVQQIEGVQPSELQVGKFDCGTIQSLNLPSNSDYFLCGPNAWMQSLRNGLQEQGVPADQIHWESFGSSPSDAPQSVAGTNAQFEVQFAHSQVKALWSDDRQTLWELARAHQVEIPSGCLSGVCGGCRVKLLKGQVAYATLPEIELADNECLTCVAVPRQDCVLDA